VSTQKRLLRIVAGVLLVEFALLAFGAGVLQSLPGVGDADARVRAILLARHGVSSGLPPPARLTAAVVAIEDQHFYSNFAVDIFDGAGRAALAVLHTSGDPGGSTIPQQLAKQLYGPGSGLAWTLRAIGLAVKLSLHFPKPTIMSMYLNAIYYGNGYWGDEQAAHGYFDTSPYALSWAEAAMLAGLPQAPSAYDPLRHLALAKQRQREVLAQLVATHVLTNRQANAAYQEVLPLR
jgi:membrane peptidoglycan carboxypeptidase